jgi:serine/threonine protein kinase
MSQSIDPGSLLHLGDFEIVREIGRGGMGVVYEARQVSLNRKVALKVLSGGLGLTPKAVHRFRRAAETAANAFALIRQSGFCPDERRLMSCCVDTEDRPDTSIHGVKGARHAEHPI